MAHGQRGEPVGLGKVARPGVCVKSMPLATAEPSPWVPEPGQGRGKLPFPMTGRAGDGSPGTLSPTCTPHISGAHRGTASQVSKPEFRILIRAGAINCEPTAVIGCLNPGEFRIDGEGKKLRTEPEACEGFAVKDKKRIPQRRLQGNRGGRREAGHDSWSCVPKSKGSALQREGGSCKHLLQEGQVSAHAGVPRHVDGGPPPVTSARAHWSGGDKSLTYMMSRAKCGQLLEGKVGEKGSDF